MVEYSNSEIRKIIDEFIHSVRDREILSLRLIDGYTFEAIAEKMGMSDRQIKTIVYKAEVIIFKHLQPP